MKLDFVKLGNKLKDLEQEISNNRQPRPFEMSGSDNLDMQLCCEQQVEELSKTTRLSERNCYLILTLLYRKIWHWSGKVSQEELLSQVTQLISDVSLNKETK